MRLKENTNRELQFGRPHPDSLPERNTDADRERRWRDWIERIANGDTEALAALYDESSPVIFSFVLKIVRDRERAEDALVAIYVRAQRLAVSFNSHWQGPLVWLITIAREIATARLRTAVPVADRGPDLFQYKRVCADSALAKLSDEERSIIEMTYMGAFSTVEVAGVLEVSTQYVQQKIVSALRKLRAVK